MRGHDRPNEGLRPLWRVEPDLERDRGSRKNAAQYKYFDHRHFPLPSGLDEGELTERAGRIAWAQLPASQSASQGVQFVN
jgi:hypothetical protein